MTASMVRCGALRRTMLRLSGRVLAVAAAYAIVSMAAADGGGGEWRERDDWGRFFEAAGVAGTIAVLDRRGDRDLRLVHDAERAERRFSPASTFKIPHALFALDAGAARDEFQRFEWDGETRWVAAWNRDQDLRSAMRHSVVWVFQRFAREIGEAGERGYLQRIGYGNADVSGGVERFWLDGGLAISAIEQIGFLRRLHDNDLPFPVADQRLVKDLIIDAANRTCILRAKTGWHLGEEVDLGWWVGWLETPEGPVFFALNIDMPRGRDDAGKRRSISVEVLDALESPTGVPGITARCPGPLLR